MLMIKIILFHPDEVEKGEMVRKLRMHMYYFSETLPALLLACARTVLFR